MNDILRQKIKELPQNSGVYIMRDKNGDIIYIGKAKVLANRVRQYFFNLSSHTPKVQAMVCNIANFEYIITNSELDALSLEATLIKKHKPFYNILLKDDKAHPYIRIDLRQKFPTMEIVRRTKADGAKYFGPYFGGVYVKDVIEIIKSAFKIRACRGNKWPASHRVCLNYHIGLCHGVCCGNISQEEYRRSLDAAIRFLNGNDDEVSTLLKARMKLASEQQLYEQAIVYRDRLSMVENLGRKIVANLERDTNLDAFGHASDGLHAAVSVVIVRGGKTIACENYPIIDTSLSPEDCVSAFMVQYYDGSRMLPPEALVQEPSADAETVRTYLSGKYGHAFHIVQPKVGSKKSIVDNAVLNATDFMVKSIDATERKREMTHGAVEGLQQKLGLPRLPRRMECYDISNISGVDKVSSMVVFFDGAPDKGAYRRFKIRTVEGANDFASMRETLSRRFAHMKDGDNRFCEPPDLIVIDGGKGQLSYSQEAMKAAGLDVPMISLAERDEEIFLPDRSAPVRLPRASVELKLLQRIRDEAHRFAVTFHRNLRSNRYLSKLEEIPRIGKERRVALMSKFRSVEAIAAASVDEIASIDGFGAALAKTVSDYFRQKRATDRDFDALVRRATDNETDATHGADTAVEVEFDEGEVPEMTQAEQEITVNDLSTAASNLETGIHKPNRENQKLDRSRDEDKRTAALTDKVKPSETFASLDTNAADVEVDGLSALVDRLTEDGGADV